MENLNYLTDVFSLNLDPVLLESMKTLALLACGVLLFQIILLVFQLRYVLFHDNSERRNSQA